MPTLKTITESILRRLKDEDAQYLDKIALKKRIKAQIKELYPYVVIKATETTNFPTTSPYIVSLPSAKEVIEVWLLDSNDKEVRQIYDFSFDKETRKLHFSSAPAFTWNLGITTGSKIKIVYAKDPTIASLEDDEEINIDSAATDLLELSVIRSLIEEELNSRATRPAYPKVFPALSPAALTGLLNYYTYKIRERKSEIGELNKVYIIK